MKKIFILICFVSLPVFADFQFVLGDPEDRTASEYEPVANIEIQLVEALINVIAEQRPIEVKEKGWTRQMTSHMIFPDHLMRILSILVKHVSKTSTWEFIIEYQERDDPEKKNRAISLHKDHWFFQGKRLIEEEAAALNRENFEPAEPHVVQMLQFLFDSSDAIHVLKNGFGGRIRVIAMDFDVKENEQSIGSVLVREEMGDGFFTDHIRQVDIIRVPKTDAFTGTKLYYYTIRPQLHIPPVEVRRQ